MRGKKSEERKGGEKNRVREVRTRKGGKEKNMKGRKGRKNEGGGGE